MSAPSPAGQLDVTGSLSGERAALLGLLAGLDPSEWQAPTECPAGSVKGIALHVLGDDLSLLSRQRDHATNSLRIFAGPRHGWTFRELLNGFNEQWVEASRFLSEALVVELLALTGRRTAEFYTTVDLDVLDEPVAFFGATGPSPYWQIVAREYMERWEHHHQIRRAVNVSGLGEEFLRPAAQVAVRHFVAHLPGLEVPPATSITLQVPRAGAWTIMRDGDDWTLFDGAAAEADAHLILDPARATDVLSRGLPRADVAPAFTTSGDPALARRAVAAIAGLTSRDSTYSTG